MEKGDDPYQILGLSQSDVSDDPSCIKKNFRQLARIHHPDKNRGEDSDAAAKIFAKINHAYEVLREEESRRSYDLSQLHSKQKGYDPNGPKYYDQNSNRNSYENTDGENISTSRTSSPENSSFSCRTASAIVTDKVSGQSKAFTFKTTSDGMTTVDIKSSDGSTSSYSVSRHDEEKHKEVYELFRNHFGAGKANDFFNTDGKRANGTNPGPGKTKSSKSNVTYYSNPKTTSTNATGPMKTKKPAESRVPDTYKSVPCTSKTHKSTGRPNTDTFDEDDDDIQSMSVKERFVVNPKTKRREVVKEITVTRFDGSVETRVERRQA